MDCGVVGIKIQSSKISPGEVVVEVAVEVNVITPEALSHNARPAIFEPVEQFAFAIKCKTRMETNPR